MSDLATLYIRVDSTGVVTASRSLDELTGKAQKVEGATKKVETATQSAGAKFAAMAGTVMKLTAAFAALAAVQRGWGLMAEAAKYEQQVRALNNLAASYNSNGNKIIADLKRISDGTINTITLVEKAGTAMMLGIAPEKISKLMEIARATARMTGQEVSTAFDNIAMAVGRQSKMILSSLGIIVSVESANRTYAVQLKKTADNLSDTEKKAAFLNATIAAGEDLIARMGQQSDTTKDKMDRLKASVDNARLMIGQGLIRVVLGATGAFQWLAAGVMTVIAIIPKLLEYMARATAKIYEWTGQTERMEASLSEAASLKKGYEDMLGAAGELAGKAADNFSAMVSSTEDMAGATNRAIPPIDGVTDTLDAAAKAAQKLREEADKINETLSNDIKMSGLDDLEKKLFEIQLKYEKLAKNPLVDKGLLSTARGIEESSARWEARSQELKKEAELTQEITKAEEELIKTIQDGYDATMAGIQKQYDADGQLLRDKLELYKDLEGFEDEYRQVQLDWIERIKNEEIKATGDVAAAEKKAAKERAQIEYNLFKTKTDYIASGFGQLQSAFTAIAATYDEGSEAAKRWQEAAKAMEIAQKAVAVVQAVAAIATQGLGDPYTAFARIAAMAATMGALLASIGTSINGAAATAVAPAMGNSTVLGAAYGTESESITNSLEILQDTYDLENSKLTKIYDELRDLNNNITGLVSGIIRTGGSFDGMTFETDAVAATKAREIFMGVDVIRSLHKWGGKLLGIKNLEIWADPISYIVNNLLGDLVQSVVTGIFGGKKTIGTIGAGYKIGGSSIKDIMSGGVNTQQYQTILSKTSGGWFHDDKVLIGTIYRKVDAEVANLFNKVFQNLGGTLVGLAEQLGTDIEDALAYKFKDIKLNLMGKDGEGISKAISEALSAAGDNAAKALFGEIVARYQQVNEGMLETAVRLVTDKESVLAVLRLTNQSFEGTTSKLIEFSESLISVAGSLDELTDAFQTYYDAFFSDAEKQADTKKALQAALGMYGFDLPGSRSGYRELVESLNLTTEAGQAAYVALMQMSQSADEYYSYLEDLANTRFEFENELLELQGKAEEALARERQKELDAMDSTLRPLQQLVWLTKDWAEKISQANSEAADAISQQISLASSAASASRSAANEYRNIIKSLTDAQESIRGGGAAETQRFESLFAVAMTGDREALSALPGAADKLLSGSLATSKSAVDYARDQGKMLLALEQAKTVSGEMASWNEYHATLLETQVSVLENIRDELQQESPDLALLEQHAGLLEDIATLLGGQTSEIITGNATQDVIANLSSLDASYSAEMLNALISGETTQTSSLEGIKASTSDTAELLRQLVRLSTASEKEKLMAKITAMQSTLDTVTGSVLTAQTTLYQRQAEIELTRSEVSYATVAQANAESQSALAHYQNLLATYWKGPNYYTVSENMATGTPFSAHGYWTFGPQTAENNAAYAAYVREFNEARALMNYSAPDTDPTVAAAIQRAIAAENQLKITQNDLLDAQDELNSLIKQYQDTFGERPPGYASGGAFVGGLRIVGEQGPELEYTGPSHIVNASKTEAFMSSNADLLAEIKKLNAKIDRLEAISYQTTKNTQKTAKTLEKFDYDGLPDTRVA